MHGIDRQSARHRPPATRWLTRAALLLLALLLLAAGAYVAIDQYRVSRLAGRVRRSFSARRYEEGREPLKGWLHERPRSADAHYYRAWLALVSHEPSEAVESIERASKFGLDPMLLGPLKGLYQARAGNGAAAEPSLREAFERNVEPRAEIARELARIYLTSYRMPEAAHVIERWRELAPEDPQPYIWSNEIEARSEGEPTIQIRNFRAALERDPSLDSARLGLAEQLSKDRRFDEAEVEYRAYLERHPTDARALVGLGRNAFQSGDLGGATKHFESALAADPRNPDALRELAQGDLRLGRFAQACQRFALLTHVEPFDHEIHYSYAQALKLNGDTDRARSETELAARLRAEHDHILKLRYKILGDPNDLASRFEVAKWMLEHGHADEGLKWTREILRADPRHAATHHALAAYYQEHGDAGLANYHRLMASTGSER
jgi:Flp pilus assembly protein TadD